MNQVIINKTLHPMQDLLNEPSEEARNVVLCNFEPLAGFELLSVEVGMFSCCGHFNAWNEQLLSSK